jgi:hypothetical protein
MPLGDDIVQKYIEDLKKKKEILERELQPYKKRKKELSKKIGSLRNDNYMLLIQKTNLNDEYSKKFTKQKLLQIYSVLISTASLYCLFIVSPALAIGLGALDAVCLSKSKKLKKEIKDGNKVSVKMLDNIVSKNNIEIYKHQALIDELDHIIDYKTQRIYKINEKISKVNRISEPTKKYKENAKVLVYKPKTK